MQCVDAGLTQHQIICIYRRMPKDDMQQASVSSIMQTLGL
jgi:hypothetical protein